MLFQCGIQLEGLGANLAFKTLDFTNTVSTSQVFRHTAAVFKDPRADVTLVDLDVTDAVNSRHVPGYVFLQRELPAAHLALVRRVGMLASHRRRRAELLRRVLADVVRADR